MEQASVLERTLPPDEVAVVPPETDYALNVVLVYQDTTTREWAARVCDQASRLVGEDSLHDTWWELGRLSDPEVLMDAALAAMQADVIVVSIHQTKELPADLRAWIDVWLPHRSVPAGALAALIGAANQPDAQSGHAQEYLRAIARKGQLDFLLKEHTLPMASQASAYRQDIAQRASAVTPLLQEMLELGQNAYHHWGINE